MYLEEIEKNNNIIDEKIESNMNSIAEYQKKLTNIDNVSIENKLAQVFAFSLPFWFILFLFLPKISLVIPAQLIQPLMLAIPLPFGTIASKIYNKRKGYIKTVSNDTSIRNNILFTLEKEELVTNNKILNQIKKKLSSKADFYKKIMSNQEFSIKPRKISLTEEKIREINEEIANNNEHLKDIANNITIRYLMNKFSFDFSSVATVTMLFVLAYMLPVLVLSLPLGYILTSLGIAALVPMTFTTAFLKIKNNKSIKVLNKVIEELEKEGLDLDLDTEYRELLSEKDKIIQNIVESKCQLMLANIEEDNSEVTKDEEIKTEEYVYDNTEELSVVDQSQGPKLLLK